MKPILRNSLQIIFALLLANGVIAQKAEATKDVQNMFNPNYHPITWLGIDLSKVVLIGDFTEALGIGASDPSTKNAYFKAWNNLITGEASKYNIKLITNNKNITIDIESIMKLNNSAKVDSLTGYKTPNYPTDTIQKQINRYHTPANKGLGTAFFVESFNRDINKATIYYVVFNLETKQIVLLKKLETSPRGSGLRNYWAGAIYEAFRTIEREFTKTWKNEYNWQ